MVEMKSLSIFLVFAALVQHAAGADFPANVCAAPGTAPLNAKSTCSYITTLNANSDANCCGSTVVPTDITKCSATCQKYFVELLCKFSCQTNLNGAQICQTAANKFYEQCSSCASIRSASSATNFFTALGATVSPNAGCIDPFLPVANCVPVYTQNVTSITVTTGGGDLSSINLADLSANVDTPQLVTFTATVNGTECGNTPLFGTWRVTVNGLEVLPTKPVSDSYEFTQVGTTFTATTQIALTKYALKAGTTAPLVVRFTSVNLAGSVTQERSVSLVQSDPVTGAVTLGATAAYCDTNAPLLLGVDILNGDLPDTSTYLVDASRNDRNCTLEGTNTQRTKVQLRRNGGDPHLNYFVRGQTSTPITNNKCPMSGAPYSARIQNIEFYYGAVANELDDPWHFIPIACVDLKNVVIKNSHLQLSAPSDDDPVTQFPVVTLDSQTNLEFSSIHYEVNVNTNLKSSVVWRGEGSVTVTSGDIRFMLMDKVSLTLVGASFTLNNLQMKDSSSLTFKTGAGASLTIVCSDAVRISAGALSVQLVDKANSLIFQSCDTSRWIGASQKFEVSQAQSTAGCSTLIEMGCSTTDLQYPLITSTASACLVIGTRNNNQDTCRGLSSTVPITAPLVNYNLFYLAWNGPVASGTNNGPMNIFAGSSVYFYNVNPQFGAVRTDLDMTVAGNTFGAGAQFKVSVASSVDKSKTVLIPLVICTPQNGQTMTRAFCVGAQIPRITPTNINGRAYDLAYYGPDNSAIGSKVTNDLFPGIMGSATDIASIGIIALSLQPVPPTTSSGVTPDRLSDFYSVSLDQNLANYPQDTFTSDVLAGTGIGTEFFAIQSYTADPNNAARIVAIFFCRDLASVDQANAKCQAAVNKMLSDPSLNAKTKAVSSGGTTSRNAPNDNQSNGALFALFALALIPIILIFAVVLFVTSKKRAADNQYSQDTSTFSTVAAQPYPNDKYYPSTPASYE